MPATDMDALMEALKRAGTGAMSATPGKPVAAKLSVMKAVPGGDDGGSPDDGGDLGDMMTGSGDEADAGDTEADNQRNSAIVDALQSDYPQIYDRLSKQVDGGDSGGSAGPAPDDGGSADMSALSP